MKQKKRKRRCMIVLCLLVALVLITIYGNVTVTTSFYEIETGKGKAEGPALRIVQLSDIHMIRSERQSKMLYEKVQALTPDLIAITGDLVDTRKYNEEACQKLTLQFCEQLCELAPVYYIYGNHEIMLLDDPVNNPFKCELERLGVVLLNNRMVTLEKAGTTYRLFGVQDPATLYKDPVYAYIEHSTTVILEDLTKNLEGDAIHICLAHRPESMEIYTTAFDMDVSLTGHAHGGQFRIPFTGIGLYAPNQGYFPKYTAGLYEKNGNVMVVSRGIGNSVIPVRLFNTPEIVVVDVR